MANTALAGHALQYMNSNSFSGASTIEFTGLNSGHQAYLFVFSKVTVSVDGATIECRTSTDNGANYDAGASDYRWCRVGRLAGSLAAAEATATTLIRVSHTIGNAAGESGSFSVHLYDPTGSGYKVVQAHSSIVSATPSPGTTYFAGERLSTTAVDAVRFLPSSGTFSGTVYVYGYKDA